MWKLKKLKVKIRIVNFHTHISCTNLYSCFCLFYDIWSVELQQQFWKMALIRVKWIFLYIFFYFLLTLDDLEIPKTSAILKESKSKEVRYNANGLFFWFQCGNVWSRIIIRIRSQVVQIKSKAYLSG